MSSLLFVLANEPPRQQAVAEVVESPVVVEAAIETPTPVTPPPTPQPVKKLTGSEYDLLRQAGVPENQLASAKALIQRESSWRLTATNYLGCIGLGQACPSGIKSVLLANCPDWETNAVCQLRVFTNYVNVRYGGWNQAKAFSDRNNWY